MTSGIGTPKCLNLALNHVTAPNMNTRAFLTAAKELGCVGVELRNDLDAPLFSGEPADEIKAFASQQGLRILALGQVYPFNDWSEKRASETKRLIDAAKACEAECISLIPQNDGQHAKGRRGQKNLRLAMQEIEGLLKGSGIVGLIEPLGFQQASLRSKADAIEAIEAVSSRARFQLVHDTFHHILAGEDQVFPEWTGIVHISGVADKSLRFDQMEDHHRGLVGAEDQLGNIGQIDSLFSLGYRGPLSMEAFSPRVQNLCDPRGAIQNSFDFIKG